MSTPSSEANQILRRATALSATDPTNALKMLESGLVNARAAQDVEGLSRLARHAGLLCAHLGDVRRALQYYDEALRFDEDEPYLYVAIGTLRRQLGEVDEAKVAFSRVLELATKQSESDLATLAQDVLNQLGKPS